jgi:hypothetical protein
VSDTGSPEPLVVVVVVYLSICFQFNRKLPFEKYSAALFCRR